MSVPVPSGIHPCAAQVRVPPSFLLARLSLWRAAMVRLYTQDVPMLPLFFNPVVSAYLSNLKGLDKDTTDANALIFNVHEWVLE